MSILVVGLSHRSAPVAVLERVSVSGDRLGKLLRDVAGSAAVGSAMVVSTCNRVEVYAEVDKFHAAVSDISELLARYSGLATERLTEYLYVHYEDRAIAHLFTMVCGLDSMAVGEAQILGQVRGAIKLARSEGTLGRTLDMVGRQALRAGKRAHAETGIDRVGATLMDVALDSARSRIGPLSGRRGLVIGAGAMSALAAATLVRAGVTDIAVANRTRARAQRLAEKLTTRGTDAAGTAVRASVVDWADRAAAAAAADVVVSCTGAGRPVLYGDDLRAAVRGRGGRGAGELMLIDLALPHDIEPEVEAIDEVTLVDLAAVQRLAAQRRTGPDETEAVRKIVADEVAGYLEKARAQTVAPTVVALRARAADVVELELSRLDGRLAGLDERSRGEIAYAMRRVVDKLLHAPTVRVKQLAGSPGGDAYAAALRELFDLDPAAPEAVARADVTLGGEDG